MSCINYIEQLMKDIDDVNYKLIDHMTDPNMRYEYICIKPDITSEYFYTNLKSRWENNAAKLVQKAKCGHRSIISPLNFIPVQFKLTRNPNEALKYLLSIYLENCHCDTFSLVKEIMKYYKNKISHEDVTKFVQQTQQAYQSHNINNTINTNQLKNTYDHVQQQVLANITSVITNLYNFSLENELDTLIPNELGSLKRFFITLITTYYNNLDPIIWAQIMNAMMKNIFIDLPVNKDEFFRFASKYILLNSGPFILKLLQMIRPVLSPELALKYNLTKLSYPLMTNSQVDLILSKALKRHSMTKVLTNKSASVGHIAIVHEVNTPTELYVVKIIKPIAIAQSCWEYKTLSNIFEKNTCEYDFVKSMLLSNGRELNVENEIENINKGYDLYTATYNDIFGTDIECKLTTIEERKDTIMPNCWYALAMTLAPGIAVSELVESDALINDTKYRAKLHRCLDILVYKFIQNIVQYGFYHGDLHAGNIFYSYEKSQMTLIDFGAVGSINLYENTDDINSLLTVIVQSVYYNYTGILDTLTDLLNTKCLSGETNKININKNSNEYIQFKKQLEYQHMNNIKYAKIQSETIKQYEDNMFAPDRIKAEINESKSNYQNQNHTNNTESVYSYLDMHIPKKEDVVENSDVIPVLIDVKNEINTLTLMTFTGALESIIKFFSTQGINMPVMFNEIYEIQKAYSLLLGVLHKVGYSGYRMNIVIDKAIKSWSNLKELVHIPTVAHIVSVYWSESKIYNDLVNKIDVLDVTQQNQQHNQQNHKQTCRLKLVKDVYYTHVQDAQYGGNSNKITDKYYKEYMYYKKKYNELKKRMNNN